MGLSRHHQTEKGRPTRAIHVARREDYAQHGPDTDGKGDRPAQCRRHTEAAVAVNPKAATRTGGIPTATARPVIPSGPLRSATNMKMSIAAAQPACRRQAASHTENDFGKGVLAPAGPTPRLRLAGRDRRHGSGLGLGRPPVVGARAELPGFPASIDRANHRRSGPWAFVNHRFAAGTSCRTLTGRRTAAA